MKTRRLPRPTAIAIGASIAALTATDLWAEAGRRQGDVLPDGTVRFRIGSADLTARSEQVLDRLASVLKRRVELDPVLLVGHADDRGTDALNERLSLGRAETVKTALVRRGIRATRLKVEGAGSREPLSLETTEAARTQNRRVEIWVTPRGPVARVGRVRRRVQAREPAAPDWRKAQKDQALRRLARVRTLEDSSSEIRFPKDDVVTMGPNALAVIFGSPSATRRSKKATANIELEEGTLFAALAEREGRVLEVQARTGRMRVRSKRARISTDAKRQQSTIGVYDGEAEVESEGETVIVLRGYGTRIRDGQAPEAPRRLPTPPEWTSTQPVFRLEGEPVELAWHLRPGVPAAEVQLGLGNDIRVERPVSLRKVDGSKTTEPIRAGMYVARIAGIDDIGLVGPSGPTRPVIVMPAPRLLASETYVTRAAPDQPLTLDRPGQVRFYAPPASVLSILGRSSTVAVDVDLYASRRIVAGLKATDGGPTRYIPIDVKVPTHHVAATIGEPLRPDGAKAIIPVDIAVTDDEGQAVDGLEFVGAPVWATSGRLLTSSSTAGVLAPCHCRAPASTTPVQALGDGRYRWTLTASVGAPLPSTVRFYSQDGARAVETELPPRLAARISQATPIEKDQNGLFTTLHAGSWLRTDEDPVFQLGLGLGGRWGIDSRLAIDGWVLGRWFQRRGANETFNIFPVTGRVALRYVALTPELYLGGGAGVRLGDPATRPVGEVFAGMLFPLASFALDLETGYTAAGSTDDIDELAGFGVRVGLRWTP